MNSLWFSEDSDGRSQASSEISVEKFSWLGRIPLNIFKKKPEMGVGVGSRIILIPSFGKFLMSTYYVPMAVLFSRADSGKLERQLPVHGALCSVPECRYENETVIICGSE